MGFDPIPVPTRDILAFLYDMLISLYQWLSGLESWLCAEMAEWSKVILTHLKIAATYFKTRFCDLNFSLSSTMNPKCLEE